MAQQETNASHAHGHSMPVSLSLEHVSPVTRLLEKRKQMLQVQEALDAQKEEYARKEELFKRREENLRKKDLELQEALVLFNKFLKENESKRRRAEARASEELKKRLKWEKQIQVHRATVAALREKCNKLKTAVARNEKYEKFLEKTQDQYAAHFEEIASIIARYATLKATNSEMISIQESLLAKNERLRIEFGEYKKKQYTTALSLNNDVASLSRQLEEAIRKTNEVEEWMIQREKEESDEQRIATQIVLATDNLYTRCKRVLSGIRRPGATRLSSKQKSTMDPVSILKEETCWKLAEIQTYLTDFRDITQSIHAETATQQQQAQALAAMQANHEWSMERARQRAKDHHHRHHGSASGSGGGGHGSMAYGSAMMTATAHTSSIDIAGAASSSFSHSHSSTHSHDISRSSQNSSQIYNKT